MIEILYLFVRSSRSPFLYKSNSAEIVNIPTKLYVRKFIFHLISWSIYVYVLFCHDLTVTVNFWLAGLQNWPLNVLLISSIGMEWLRSSDLELDDPITGHFRELCTQTCMFDELIQLFDFTIIISTALMTYILKYLKNILYWYKYIIITLPES